MRHEDCQAYLPFFMTHTVLYCTVPDSIGIHRATGRLFDEIQTCRLSQMTSPNLSYLRARISQARSSVEWVGNLRWRTNNIQPSCMHGIRNLLLACFLFELDWFSPTCALLFRKLTMDHLIQFASNLPNIWETAAKKYCTSHMQEGRKQKIRGSWACMPLQY